MQQILFFFRKYGGRSVYNLPTHIRHGRDAFLHSSSIMVSTYGVSNRSKIFNIQSTDYLRQTALPSVCYSSGTRSFNLGLRHDFTWNFFIVHVDRAIIDADLLVHYGVVINLQDKQLIDKTILRVVK